MSTYRCYHCGFETRDKGAFIGDNCTSTQHWAMFICPQCSFVDPPVAEVSSGFGCQPAYKYPRWTLEETNHGLYVKAYSPKGGSSSAPMIPDHQLAKQPASLLRPELEGTLWDHHKRLIEQGDARSAAFKADCDAIPEGTPLNERLVITDKIREKHQLGPHDDRVEHNGAVLMHRAGLSRAA